MKIASVRIQNFRSFADTTISLSDYTCLVGPNGAGKSTVLTALNVFFRESENVSTDVNRLDIEDFHLKRTGDPIRISVTFTDLSEEATEDFSDYVRQGQLVVSAEAIFDQATGNAEVKQYGQRRAMLPFAPYFAALGDNKKVAELKEIYNELRATYPDLPNPRSKAVMTTGLRDYEARHPDKCELIPSEDQFYGFSGGANRLDRHVQWVYVPAVKDATSEQVEARNSALGKLLARTVRSKTNFDQTVSALRTDMQKQYQTLLNESQDALEEVSRSLQGRLSEWAHPDATVRLEWQQDPDKSVRVDEPLAHIVAGEDDFEGKLARFGHGLQRSYVLALLQELAGTDDAGGPTLILACEEPELYQHPPQARHLGSVLHALSQGNAQVVVSTHSPLFVSGEGFEGVRLIRKNQTTKCSIVSSMSYEELATAVTAATGEEFRKLEGALAKIHQALQPALNEMFFTPRLILVEGLEDEAYLTAYMNLLGHSEDYRRIGCHIVPTNGKSQLIPPLIIAKHFGIRTYVVFDADADKPDRSGSRVKHQKDNEALLTLLGSADQCAMPDDTIWGTGFTIWHSDIGSIVASDIGEEWVAFREEADRRYGQAGGLQKNALHIGASLAFASDAGKRSANLEQLCQAILDVDNSVPENGA